MAAEPYDDDEADEEGEELLQKFADDGADGELHAIDIVDERGENGAGGVPVEEARGSAQRDFVQMIAQVGDHAEARVIHEVCAEIVAEALDDRRCNQCEGYHGPRIVHEMRDDDAQVEMPRSSQDTKSNGAFRSGGIQNGVEDWLKKQGAEVVEKSDCG